LVAVPTCFGEAPTIVGTSLNNVISGTAGRDTCVSGETRRSSCEA
jgi:hypothetical protein